MSDTIDRAAGMATCYDCRERFNRDVMHLIKAPTLNGRALICEPCHVAEVARIRAFNLENSDRIEAQR